MSADPILNDLYDIIQERKQTPEKKSYVASLIKGGVSKIGAKITEEAQELIESANLDDDNHTIHEAADLLFHTLVLLGYKEIHPDAVLAELRRRFGTSGITEKESRNK